MDRPTVAVLVPCFDEEAAVGVVVADLRRALPDATVYVYDNASTDRTVEVARAAGAVVRSEPRRGKGNVVRRAFADLDADVIVMIDGDDTYDASAAGLLVETLLAGPHDQVVGVRREVHDDVHRTGHAAGNRAFAWLVSRLFDHPTDDLFSGYRAFSRRFVRSFPGLSSGFEIETELTVHAARLRLPTAEVPVGFKDRPAGGASKLRTVRDGSRILWTVLRLLWLERPVLVHTLLAAALTLVALVLGVPVVLDFLDSGLVERLPTAVLATGLVLLASLSVGLGVLLAAQKRGREEQARLWYLAQPPPAVAHEAQVLRAADGP
jgi:hypothetical protein